MHALVRARIPYLPVHIDDIAQNGALRLLILPNVGAVSDAQATAIRGFVRRGGSVLATGDTSLYTEWGDPRSDFALADLFGAHRIGPTPGLSTPAARGSGRSASDHTYLRLTPELRARVDGPKAGDEPRPAGERHEVFRGFDETDILPFGGTLAPLRVDTAATVLLTLVPAFPTYPPETAWMREPKSNIPGLVLSQHGAARVAYMPADIDRRYAKEHLPDHAALLANLIRWTAGPGLPLAVEGPGLVDCHLYEQPGRWILHLVNLTSEATWRAPLDELIPVGPFTVKVRLPRGTVASAARLLVSGREARVVLDHGYGVIGIDSIRDHEVIVIE